MQRLSFLLLSVTLAGCSVLAPDGARCLHKSECKSGSCISGYCEGGGCSCAGNSDCTSDNCEKGWLCKYSAPDPVTGFFGNPGSHRCVPLCGVCPPDYTCATPGTRGECSYVAPVLTVNAGGPYKGRPGQAIQFHATASSPVAPIESYTWQFGDGQMATGADVTHVYQAQLFGQVNLLVVDQVQDTGGTTAVLAICGGAGAHCAGGPDQCCAGTSCDSTDLLCH